MDAMVKGVPLMAVTATVVVPVDQPAAEVVADCLPIAVQLFRVAMKGGKPATRSDVDPHERACYQEVVVAVEEDLPAATIYFRSYASFAVVKAVKLVRQVLV
jgi:hypothetical protein